MAENSKPVGDSESLSFRCELELRDLDSQKMKISNQEQSRAPDSDGFVVDIESLSHDHGVDRNINSNSRISVKMRENLSRKGSERSESTTTAAVVATGDEADCSSNGGSSYSDPISRMTFPLLLASDHEIISKEPIIKPQVVQQQVTTVTSKVSKLCRRYSRQRSYSTRLINPRRVFLFFAALSSMGTIILIYFSLSIARLGDDHSSLQ